MAGGTAGHSRKTILNYFSTSLLALLFAGLVHPTLAFAGVQALALVGGGFASE